MDNSSALKIWNSEDHFPLGKYHKRKHLMNYVQHKFEFDRENWTIRSSTLTFFATETEKIRNKQELGRASLHRLGNRINSQKSSV